MARGRDRPAHRPTPTLPALAPALACPASGGGGPAHGALSHLSALRDSWEGHEAQHVPSRIGAGRSGEMEGGFQHQLLSAHGQPQPEKDPAVWAPAKSPFGVQAPRPCLVLLEPTAPCERQTYNFIPRHRDFRCQAWPSSGSDPGPSSLLSELPVDTSAEWP